MKRTLLALVLAALLGGATTAVASDSVPNVFGHGGDAIHFDAACHRPTWAKPNALTLRQGQSVVAQQARCLVRRPTFAACVRKLGPVPQVSIWRKDDWKGVDELQQYVTKMSACAVGTF